MKRASHRNTGKPKKIAEVSALQIIEEGFHLLRTSSGSALWLYFFGTVPFVCLLFYSWADLSRSSYDDRDSGLVALCLAFAFFWKCSWQARFCRSLWDSVSPGSLPKPKGWQRFRYHSALWLYQAFSIPLVLLSFVFILPIGWVTTAFQNGYVLSLTQDYRGKPLRRLIPHAFKNSHYQWAQNHGVWLTMSFIGLLSWLNIVALCALPPLIGKTFFGIESVFSISPAVLSNSTFVFGTLLINYLILSPLIKAIFVLRCFYADARTTGADLRSRLATLRQDRSSKGRRTRSTPSKKIASVALGMSLLFALSGMGQEKDRLSSALDTAIQDTMEAKKYQWKLSKKIELEEADSELSWLQIQLTNLADAVEAKARIARLWIKEKFKELIDKLKLRDRDKKQSQKPPTIGEGTAKVLMNIGWGILIAIVAGLVGWLVFALVKRFRDSDGEESEDGNVIGEIDLESEDIVADQLPEDEWMKLAREQLAKGESRLAIRALFLATLANLGERDLLRIQKYKSNRDYRLELELKARQKVNLREAFSENTGLFERAWYGLHQIGDEAVAHFMENYDTITSEPT